MNTSARIALVWLMTAAACAVCSSSAGQERDGEPFGAEDHGSEDNAVLIPEPLVFDLVRGLGADRGELEVNVLIQQPLSDIGSHPTEWAPEIEAAIFDGVALELELPFEDGELVAEKFAFQGTFGVGFDDHFIHGTQFIAEHLRDTDAWELTLLYVPGVRFNRTWSALAMVGLRTLVGGDDIHDDEPKTEALLNFSLFADVTHRMTLGVETNYAASTEQTSVLAMPQAHFEVTDHFMLQGGVGVRFANDEETLPEAALRIIYSF